MFGLFKKNNTIESGILNGMVDIHSHLMFGVDDGSKNIEQSLNMLNALAEMGVKKIFCTPHIKSDLTSNTPELLKRKFAEFEPHVAGSKIDEVRLAAEYMIDEAFIDKIRQKELLTYDDKHILVEMSYYAPSRNRDKALFELQVMGLVPILAHPERYIRYETLETLHSLKERGIKFQLNLASLSGAYGDSVRRFSIELLNMDMYDFTGSDIHSPLLISYMRGIKGSRKLWEQLEVLVKNNATLWK